MCKCECGYHYDPNDNYACPACSSMKTKDKADGPETETVVFCFFKKDGSSNIMLIECEDGFYSKQWAAYDTDESQDDDDLWLFLGVL